MNAQHDRAERLKIALFFGQHHVVESLLAETPELGRANLGLAIALYDIEHLAVVLADHPDRAKQVVGVRSPICHLAFSQHIHGQGSQSDMLAVAEALVAAGADVNDFYNYNGDPNSPLSILYGALGHANNLVLAKWLLERGANPNDGESLYHSTELGHRDGLRLLLDSGANPKGTNALPRALDFNDHKAVQMLLEAGADPNEGIEEHPSGEPPWVIPALHQAARRMCDERMINLLLDAGADPSKRYKGMTPYAVAMVYGNKTAASLIKSAGGDTNLSGDEKLLAAAADGTSLQGKTVTEDQLPDEYRDLIRAVLGFPNGLSHVRRLIEIGLDPNRPDNMGLTPLQIAGWEGLPEALEYFLGLNPDLDHVNDYGGNLLSTIIHGSENCPSRDDRDHVACARLALNAGVGLPRRAIELAGVPEMANFLAGWAKQNPDRVADGGPA